MCNRPRLPIDYVIDYLFFEDNRNRNRHFKKKNNRNRQEKNSSGFTHIRCNNNTRFISNFSL